MAAICVDEEIIDSSNASDWVKTALDELNTLIAKEAAGAAKLKELVDSGLSPTEIFASSLKQLPGKIITWRGAKTMIRLDNTSVVNGARCRIGVGSECLATMGHRNAIRDNQSLLMWKYGEAITDEQGKILLAMNEELEEAEQKDWKASEPFQATLEIWKQQRTALETVEWMDGKLTLNFSDNRWLEYRSVHNFSSITVVVEELRFEITKGEVRLILPR